MSTELVHELLPALRRRRGLSAAQLSLRTGGPDRKGVGEKTIQAIEAARGRVPDADILEALADALEVEATAFYEYPIALARRAARARIRPAPGEDEETLRLAGGRRIPRPGEQDAGTG